MFNNKYAFLLRQVCYDFAILFFDKQCYAILKSKINSSEFQSVFSRNNCDPLNLRSLSLSSAFPLAQMYVMFSSHVPSLSVNVKCSKMSIKINCAQVLYYYNVWTIKMFCCINVLTIFRMSIFPINVVLLLFLRNVRWNIFRKLYL